VTTRDIRETLIEVGRPLVAEQGFSATGVKAIVDAAGVPKGSFYHYFESKDQFGEAVIAAYRDEQTAALDEALADASRSPLARLRAFFEAGNELQISDDCRNGCLIGTLGQELSPVNEELRQVLAATFSDWDERLARVIAEAQRAAEVTDRASAETLAVALLSNWEGAVLRAKMSRSRAPLDAFLQTTFGLMLAP
jgi:TetR/AcrR family transcriptional repressor of nem operon